jgi:cholesterol transport system auxiliary component
MMGEGAMNKRRSGAIVLALAALSGCVGLGGGKAPAALFTLTPASSAPAGDLSGGQIAQALLVMEPETDKRLAVLRVPVQVSDVQGAYLTGGQWVERPARLFRGLLAETLRARGGKLVIEDDQPVTKVDTRLSGRLLELGYDARSGSVIARYDAILTGPKGEVRSRRFESVIKGVAPKAGAVGPALNDAANAIAQEVAAWVGS